MQQFSTSPENQAARKAALEKQPSLPVDVPESETLWLFLTKGYSLNYIRESLVCGIPHLEAEARMLRDRAHKNWSQIRAEVGHGIDLKTPAQGAEGAPLAGEASAPGAAINFGDDVSTAPTSPTVPVGNTGTTSRGRNLTLAPVMSFQAMHLQKLRVMKQACVRRYGEKHPHSLSLEASLRLEASYLLTTESFYFWDKP